MAVEETKKEETGAQGGTDGAGTEGKETKVKEAEGNGGTEEKKEEKKEVDLDAERKKWMSDLGMDEDDEDAADAIKEFLSKRKEDKEKAKSDADKAREKILAEKAARLKAEAEAANSKAMVQAMKLGAKPDCVEDVIALVLKKTGGKVNDLESAVGEIKKKYPSMFSGSEETESEDSKGTKKTEKKGMKGTGGYYKEDKGKEGKEDEEGSIGKRLAKMRAGSAKKSVYFSK